jgi:hypothetical protein
MKDPIWPRRDDAGGIVDQYGRGVQACRDSATHAGRCERLIRDALAAVCRGDVQLGKITGDRHLSRLERSAETFRLICECDLAYATELEQLAERYG